MHSARDRTLAQLAIALGLATPVQVEEAVQAAAESDAAPPLDELLVSRGILRREDATLLGEILRITAAAPATGSGKGSGGASGHGAATTSATLRTDPVPAPAEAQTLTESAFARPPSAPPADTAPDTAAGAGVRPPSTVLPSRIDAAFSPHAASLPGAAPPRVLGPFELLEELGRGGMGVVYRARHRRLDRVVALKLLGAGVGAPEELERFHREAQSAARLHHPGIVEIYDVGEIDGRPYIAMEYVAGTSLDQHLARRQPPLRARIDLLRRIAEAVEEAHAQGIVHRDLKPGNVLVDPAGRPRVADFGLAKEVKDGSQSLTRSGAILGTPQYMSPEQADGDGAHIGPPSDVFSLGVMLYEILTGRRPFVADRPVALIVKILSEEITPPRRLDPRVPLDLDTVCMKALEKDWRQRYASAGALAADLGRWLEGEPIAARPTTIAYRAWKRVRRNPAVSGLVAALVVAGVTLAGLGWRAWERDRAAERARRDLIEGNLRELARSGQALLDAALARRALGDLKGSAAYALAIDEPVRRLVDLAPFLAEPWYYRGRMERALGRLEAAERTQDRAVELARAAGATPGSRAVLLPALYERGILRASSYQRLRAEAQQRLLQERAAGRAPDATLCAIPSVAEVEAARPALAALRRAALADLTEVERGAGSGGSAGADALPGAPGRAEGRMHAARGVRAALAGGTAAETEASLQRALEVDPYMEEVYSTLAGLCAERGEWEHAAAWYEKGRQLDRGFAPHVEGLAWALAMGARAAEATGRDGAGLRRRAMGALDQALEMDPRRADLLNRKAQAHIAEAEARHRHGEDPEPALAAALAAAERAAAADPKSAVAPVSSADAWSLRADALCARGQDPRPAFAAALAAYDRALALDPRSVEAACNSANARTARAEWRRAHGEDPGPDYAAALALHEQVIALRPRDAEAEHNRALVFLSRGEWRQSRGEDPTADYAAALAGYGRALAIDPRMAESANSQANVHRALGDWHLEHGADPAADYERALASWRQALAINPAHVDAANSEAILHWTLGNRTRDRGEDPTAEYARAQAGFERALSMNPRYAQAANNLGNLFACRAEWRRRGGGDPSADFTQARAAYDRALAINPEYTSAVHNQANVCLAQAEWLQAQGGDATAACRQALAGFERAARNNPNLWQAHVGRGMALEFLGRGDEAVGAYEAALRVNPGVAQVQALLERARGRSGPQKREER